MSERSSNFGTDGANSRNQPLVLVIDDYEALLRAVRLSLSLNGFEIITAATAEDGLRLAMERRPDVVCLDLRLGESAGQDLLTVLKEQVASQVIIMTAVHEEHELLACLRLGADEIVTKPFLPDEDLAPAIRFLTSDPAAGEMSAEPIPMGQINIDRARGRVTRVTGEEIPLSWTEWRLLQVLLARPGLPVLQRELLSKVWGPRFQGYVELLQAWMSRLSEKMHTGTSTGNLIADFLGVGYVIGPQVTEPERQ
jgi:two-component system, OmpR family, KDP operon response regulator KdpE